MSLLSRFRFLAPLAAFVLVCGLFSALAPDTFARPETFVTMARQTVVVGVAAVGMTYVVLSAGIDLAVGSQVALSTVLIALSLKAGAGPVAASLGAIAACSAVGLSLGLLIARGGLSPFIATLFAMTALRGAAKGLAHEQKIDVDARGIDALLAPSSFLPPGVLLFAAVAVVGALVLRHTRFGRHVVATGSSERTARLAGVDTARVKALVYALSGALAGLSGVLEFATLTVGDPTDSAGLELEVIAAVVVGGGSLSGGQGSIAGSVVGALLMTAIRAGCTHVGLPNWVQEIVTGVIIAGAVLVDRRDKLRA